MTEISESAPIDAAKSGGEGRKLNAGTKTYLYVSLLLVAGIPGFWATTHSTNTASKFIERIPKMMRQLTYLRK